MTRTQNRNRTNTRSTQSRKGAKTNTKSRNTSARTNSRGKNERGAKQANPNDARGVILGLVCVIAAILHFTGDSNGFFTGLHNLADGLMGSLSIVVPILLGWLCVRAFRASHRGETGVKWIIAPVLEVMCLLTIVQSFHVDKLRETLSIEGYFNFIGHAYGARLGGGVLGSIVGYPLTRVLTEWGVLVVFTALMIFILHSDGLISVFNIASFLSAKGRAAGKKIGDVAGDVGHRVSDSIRTRAAERKQSEEELFIDDIYKGDGEQGVEAYDLSKGSRRKTKVTQVNAVGDELVVPEIKPATNKTGKRAKSEDTEAYRRYESTPDILEELRNEDPKARNDKFMRDALSDHSAPRKPVLTFDYTPNSEKTARKTDAPQKTAEAKAYSFEKNDDIKPSAAKAETSPDRPKQPQQPKPSFFDKPVDDAGGNKTVRQNTEQGKPGDTTYVKPPMAKETEVSSGWQTVKSVQSPAMSAGKPQNALDKAQSEAPKARQAAEAPKPERVYYYPPMELMESGGYGNADRGIISADKDRERAEILVNKLKDFSIPVKLTGISHGPAVTRFEVLPAPNIKVSRVAAFADDIAMALEAESVRIEAPIPGKNAVGVEVPNIKKEVVHLRDVLESNEARRNNKRLMVGLGKDNAGKYIVADLGSMPHVLIAGQTGSGKSVCINAMIISILYRSNPDEVKMIMIDPKMVELAVYGTIPHLLVPVVTDPKKAAGALEWAVGEMQRRYKVFAEHNAKNIEYYNNHLPERETKMPRIVIIIDELADLMMTSARDVEDAINRLAQLARAAGMHLVIATQRPSVNVITGLIKANIPTRIAFTVASGVDSRTILDSYGAEKLLGKGDMLYLPSDRNKPMRMQGAWVSDDEVQAIVDHVSGGQKAEFDEGMMEHMANAGLSDAEKKDKKDEEANDETDELFEEALRCVVEAGQASISMLQRKLRVGYARAGRLVDMMARMGYVSASEGSKSRDVLITREQFNQIFQEDV